MKGIFLYQSNRLEALADELTQSLITNKKRGFSLEPELILVNNYEMAQWLSIYIAERLGICANVEFKLVGSYLWELAGWLEKNSTVITDQAIGRKRLKWLIFATLFELISKDVSKDVSNGFLNFLEKLRPLGPKYIYHLSGQLAAVFDGYMNYRFDMLELWESGFYGGLSEKDKWQPELWKLLQKKAGERFKVTFLLKLLEGLRQGNDMEEISLKLPKVIHLFGISYLPPLHLNLIDALSGHCKVDVYHFSPCRKYWADVVSEKKRIFLARKYDQKTLDELFPVGNRLLASMGTAGRNFLFGFYNLDFANTYDLSVEPEENSLLSQLQCSILDMKEEVKLGLDDSIEFHSCHGPMREVEVLHDRLVDAFLKDKSLKPHEVLVMAPDIYEYKGAIEAVFGSSPKERYIPYTIGDMKANMTSIFVSAFLQLLHTVKGEFTAPELIDLLANPVIASRFELDDDSLYTIRNWIRQSRMRRGMETLSPSCSCFSNTMLFGLERLMITALMDSNDVVELDNSLQIAPIDFPIEGDRLRILGQFSSFLSGCHLLRKRLDSFPQGGLSPSKWLEFLMDVIKEFLSLEPYSDELLMKELIRPLEDLFEHMTLSGVKSIPVSVVFEAIDDCFSESLANKAYISGKVLFSSLVPMRSLPFKVICLLGMNQGKFPKYTLRPEYDLIAKEPRPGDRIARDEDKYLFLETLMSARKRLIFIYTGRRQSDNQKLDPSPVVSELLSFLEEFAPEGSLVTEHPLQPFGSAYLKDKRSSKLKTYSIEWLPVDESGRPLKKDFVKPLASWPCDLSHLIKQDEQILKKVSLKELSFFVLNPVRYFLKNLLSVDVDIGDEILEDHETYTLNYLEQKRLLTKIAEHFVKEDEIDDAFFKNLYTSLILKGIFPDTNLARYIWDNKIAPNFAMLMDICKKISVPKGYGEILASFYLEQEDDISQIEIDGRAGFITSKGGLINFLPSASYKTKIDFWIKYLLWCVKGLDKDAKGYLLTQEKHALTFDVVPSKHAISYFKAILSLFLKGQSGLVSFLPDVSYVFAKKIQPKPKKDERGLWSPVCLKDCSKDLLKKAVKAANDYLDGQISFGSKYKDPWLMYLTRGKPLPPLELLQHKEFQQISLSVCAPMFWAMEKGR